jgi:predicted ATPase
MINQFLFVGAAGSGKTTAARAFAKAGGWDVAELGEHLRHLFAMTLWDAGKPDFNSLHTTRRTVNASKLTHRSAHRDFGNAVTALDPAILVRGCMHARVVVGMRRECEFKAYREEFPNALRCVILVARPHMETAQDGFEFTFFQSIARHVLMNTGTSEDLEEKARNLAMELR